MTGLRGVAACLVVVYHFTAGGAAFGPLAPMVSRGYQAVDLFFVLSGWVMALTYADSFRNGVAARATLVFLVRRLGRVYPLYAVTTLACLALGTTEGPVSWATLAANLALVQGWGLADSIGGPTWSISTEFAGYIVFPMLVLLILPGRRAWGAAALCVGVLAAVAVQPDLAVHQADTRNGPLDVFAGTTLFPLLRCLTGFTLGITAFVAGRWVRLQRWAALPWVGDGLALAALALAALPGTDVLLVVVFTPLVAALATGRSLAARALASPVPYALGVVSYSIYLVHRPVEHVVRGPITAALASWHVPHAFTISALICAVPVLAVAVLTFVFIEKPGRNWSRGLLRSRLLTRPRTI